MYSHSWALSTCEGATACMLCPPEGAAGCDTECGNREAYQLAKSVCLLEVLTPFLQEALYISTLYHQKTCRTEGVVQRVMGQTSSP